MTIHSTTSHSTEADFEARIHGVLLKIFPWLNSSSITHQNQFCMKFGHAEVMVNSKNIKRKSARLDILINYEGKPLAILELKREGVSLSEDDVRQGLSYARMIEVMPPLVIVTNGLNTKIFQAYDGKELIDDTIQKKNFTGIMNAIGKVASSDLEDAINTLLGTNDDFWKKAINYSTDTKLSELEGEFSDISQPFVKSFIIHRKVTNDIESLLIQGKKMVILEGPPLSGKSSVLREIAINSYESNEQAVLFIEADSTHEGLFQSIANMLSNQLSWSLGQDDIRKWFRNISDSDNKSRLVIAVDGVCIEQEKMRRDIDELASKSFGQNIQLILTLDTSVTKKWTHNQGGRKSTVIGRVSNIVSLTSLTIDEFKGALSLLNSHRVTFTSGFFYSREYRLPRVLRFVMAKVTNTKNYDNDKLVAVIPSLLGLDIFSYARDYLSDKEEITSIFSALAKCVIKDILDPKCSISLKLESMSAFLIQTNTLKKNMSYAEINHLKKNGYIKQTFLDSESREVVIIPQLPEILALSIAEQISITLFNKMKNDLASAAEWLVNICSYLPMGEVIGAQAIIMANLNNDGFSIDFINKMLEMKPKKTGIEPGTKAAMHYPGIGTINLEFTKNGDFIATTKGHKPVLIEGDQDEKCEFQTASDFTSWLILSHLSGMRIAIFGENSKNVGELSPALLLEVSTCPLVLRRPAPANIEEMIHIHEIPDHGEIACHKNGIVEPVTSSLLKFLSTWDAGFSNEWVQQALQRNSLPLLTRIDIALREISDFSDKEKSSWAISLRQDVITPAINKLSALH